MPIRITKCVVAPTERVNASPTTNVVAATTIATLYCRSLIPLHMAKDGVYGVGLEVRNKKGSGLDNAVAE
jgi:hypothetical protein